MPLGVLTRGYLCPTTIAPSGERIVGVVELEVFVENKDLESVVDNTDLVLTMESTDLETTIETEDLVIEIDPDLILEFEEDC